MKVLLIGFGPFPGVPKNPSADLVRMLAHRRRPALAGVSVRAEILPTTYEAVATDLPRLLAAHDPDVVLFFGLAARSRALRVEMRAQNKGLPLHPDAAGKRPLQLRGPESLAVRAPAQRLLAAAASTGLPARLSRDAGRYICNAALYGALARNPRRPKSVAFIHIPRPGARRPLTMRGRRRPSLSSMARAAEAVLVAQIAAARAPAKSRNGT